MASMRRYSRYARRLRASRTVHFPNDVVFQDHIRQGDLEQVGRFIRARKVTLDTIYPSGECWSSGLDGWAPAFHPALGEGQLRILLLALSVSHKHCSLSHVWICGLAAFTPVGEGIVLCLHPTSLATVYGMP
uniref:Uncharacterized protein n=1 Tax=Athene cunicularia TaxID=194338 RepID=A0A663M7L5_ATHCN